MGMVIRDEDRQLHRLDHLSLDRNIFSAIIVGGGVIVISSAPVSGALIGGP